MIKKINIVLIALMVLFFAGCSLTVPVEDLISPPKLSEEQADIFRALSNSKGTGLILKYPKTGEYRSAFVIREENPRQVMVFYERASSASAEPALWLTFLIKRDGKWECAYELSFFASEIEKVEFAKLGDKETDNIIISYSLTGQTGKGLSAVYFDEAPNISEESGAVPIETLILDNCVYYEVNDFTESGLNGLFAITSDKENRVSYAYVYAWRENEFSALGRTALNPDASEYASVERAFIGQELLGETWEKRSGIILEYARADGLTYNTDVIYWNKGRLANAVYTSNEERREENLSLLEKRPNAFGGYAYSRDIDGDGIIEIGGNVSFLGYDNANLSDRVRMVAWRKLNESNRFENVIYTYLSANNDFWFVLPEDKLDSITAVVNSDLDRTEVVFLKYSDEYESVADANIELLSLIAVARGENPNVSAGLSNSDISEETSDLVLYDNMTNPLYDYYYRINPEFEGEFISKEEIGERFKIFN